MSRATNSWVLSALRYYMKPLRWSKRELLALDQGIRRRLRVIWKHHNNSAVERFSLPRSEGGRGYLSCQSIYIEERLSAATYLALSDDPLLQQVATHQKHWEGKHPSLMQEAEMLLKAIDEELHLDRESLVHNKLKPKIVV